MAFVIAIRVGEPATDDVFITVICCKIHNAGVVKLMALTPVKVTDVVFIVTFAAVI